MIWSVYCLVVLSVEIERNNGTKKVDMVLSWQIFGTVQDRQVCGTRPVEAFKTSVAGSACNGHLIRKAIRSAVGLEDRLRADSVGCGVLNRD